jgi:hypothetical protein
MTKAAFDLAILAGKEQNMGMLNPSSRHGIAVEAAHAALFLASGTLYSLFAPDGD